MKFKNYIIFLAFFSIIATYSQKKIYVSSNGDDSNAGTVEKPLATLIGARDVIREYKKKGSIQQSFFVVIEDGTYYMTTPLVLSPEDSGTEEFPVIYKAAEGAKPIFSGGRKVSGFRINKKGLWETKVSETLDNNWNFDQLYVNEKRATLARTPNVGFLNIDNVEENILEKDLSKVAKKAKQILYFDKSNYNSLLRIRQDEIKNVRFRAFHKWDFTLRHIEELNANDLSIVTSGKGMKPWNPLKKEGRIIFENYEEALDNDGEWFLKDDGRLLYQPLLGETIEKSVVIAPFLENIVTIKGSASQNTYVSNIQFEGISFKHCHYKIPLTGSEPNQAASFLNAAIMIEGARRIIFLNCEVSQIGQHAIIFGNGCSDSVVEHCFLNNLGGGGIYLGKVSPDQGVEHTQKIRLENNILQNGGQEFPAAVGIWLGHSSDNFITHNDIGNFYYTGISVGWVWGYAPSLAKNNIISFNHIHHIGWDLLSDMAGIYTLGASEGTIVANNLIHDVHAYSYGGWGMYADEGSTGITFENNLVYNTKTGGFQQNYGKDNIVRNNILAFGKNYQVQSTVAEKHISFDFKNNIVIFNQGMVLKGAWDKVEVEMDYNIYWNTSDTNYSFNSKSLKKWKKMGHDKNSIIADPYFNNPSKFDFSFVQNKNYKKINFTPFDYKKAGVYGDQNWIEKAKLPETVINAFDKVVEENMKMDIKR